MEMTKKLKKLTAGAVAACLAVMELPALPAVTRAADPPDVPDFSYIGAVGSLTAEESQKVAEATYTAIALHKPAAEYAPYGLDLNSSNKDAFISIFRYVMCCNEVGIGAADTGVSWSPSTDSILISYRFEDSEYDAKYAEYKAMLDDIAAPVKPSWSDEEKALYFHEYITANFDYDYPAYFGQVTRADGEQYSAYGMLKNGMAVCEGYSNLYAMLLNKVGVPAKLVTSIELGHAWNAVRIDGDWYFADATWDDLYYGYKGFVKHENFLTTRDELVNSSTKHDSTDWVDSFKNDMYSAAVPTTFSTAFWRNNAKTIQRYQNKWLALTGEGVDVQFTLYSYNGATHTATSAPLTEPLNYSMSEWDVPDKPGYSWGDSYCVPVVVNDILYFSAPKAVYSYHNGQYIELHHITAAEEASYRIYGLYSKGGKLWYGLDSKRRNRNDVLTTPEEYYPLDLSTLEAKVIEVAGAPTFKENSWTSPLKISDWKVGEAPSVPTATAKYGEPVFTYYNAADDTLLAGAPAAEGSYYVIATVAGTEEYDELVSEPVSFKVEPAKKENEWTSPLKISNWKVGEPPSVPTATAKYGEPVFAYYNAADDTLLAGPPAAEGNYYVIATVAATAEYEGLVSEPVSFKVVNTAVTITIPDTAVIYREPAVFDIQVSGNLTDAEKEAVRKAVKVTCYGDPVYSPTDVGTYPITVDFDETAFSEHTFTYSLGTLTVTKRTPILDPNGSEDFIMLAYSGEPAENKMPNHLFHYNFDEDWVLSYKWYRKESDGTYTELAESPIHCGDYKAEITMSETKNYNEKIREIPVYIKPVALTAEIESRTITYGDTFSGKVKVKYKGLCDADKELFPRGADSFV